MAASDFVVGKEQSEITIGLVEGGERASAVYTVTQGKDKKKLSYYLTLKGRGDYGLFEDVEWFMTANMLKRDGILFTNESATTVRGKDNSILAQYRREYDHIHRKARVTVDDRRHKIRTTKTFPIRGPVCDDATLVHFIRAFYADHEQDAPDKPFPPIYLLTSEPKMYKVNVKKRGTEALTISGKEVQAVKLQLMADLGPLTELAAKLVPPTYIWLTEKPPYYWLQYEGMEFGYKSAHVRTLLRKRTPSIF